MSLTYNESMSKQKVSGRIVFAGPGKSMIYWKCPGRGCDQIHYFTYTAPDSGMQPVYEKTCPGCEKTYSAKQVTVSGTTAMLVAALDKP